MTYSDVSAHSLKLAIVSFQTRKQTQTLRLTDSTWAVAKPCLSSFKVRRLKQEDSKFKGSEYGPGLAWAT